MQVKALSRGLAGIQWSSGASPELTRQAQVRAKMREGLAATLDLARQELQAQGVQEEFDPGAVAQEVEHALYVHMGNP